MDRRLIWTERASSDIEAIVRYIARRNPNASGRIGLGIYQRAQILLTHPEAGTTLDELREILPTTKDRIDLRLLQKQPGYLEARGRKREKPTPNGEHEKSDGDQTPEELEVREDGFYDYNPGHGSRRLLFLVTPNAECWELTGSRTGRQFELRIVDGRVVWVDPATGAREPMRRVRNPWRIWYYQFIGDGKDLRRDAAKHDG